MSWRALLLVINSDGEVEITVTTLVNTVRDVVVGEKEWNENLMRP